MTYCLDRERCRNSYLTTCTNLILCRAICLRPRRSPSGNRTSLHEIYVCRTRVRCWSFARLGIIIPRIYPGWMYRAARDAGLPTLRASEDNVGRSTTRSFLSYLNVSPIADKKFMFYLPRFYALASKDRDGALERSTSVIYHTMPP